MAKKNLESIAREAAHELSRRSLIRWTLASCVAAGLKPWRAFEILEGAAGKGIAEAASKIVTNRSVHVIAGNGGFAWFQLLWPHNGVAAAANANLAFHAPGQHTMASGTDKPLSLAPEAPWKTLDGSLQVTALMAGNNETHTNTPTSSSVIAAGTSIFATAAALQSVNPTLIPVIAVDDAPFGTAAGAPAVARVPGPDDIVGLFNSAVSRAGGLLANPSDAEMYNATFKALVSINAVANNPATFRSLDTGMAAANLIGTNLATQLAVTPADLTRYGIDGTTPARVTDFARSLIITAKAFNLGLRVRWCCLRSRMIRTARSTTWPAWSGR